jgi:hypothetical protein
MPLIINVAYQTGKTYIVEQFGKEYFENVVYLNMEIQACERALTALKYFCEQTPEYHVVAAGSLLGVAMDTIYDAQIFLSQKAEGISRCHYELFKGMRRLEYDTRIAGLSVKNKYLLSDRQYGKSFWRIPKMQVESLQYPKRPKKILSIYGESTRFHGKKQSNKHPDYINHYYESKYISFNYSYYS